VAPGDPLPPYADAVLPPEEVRESAGFFEISAAIPPGEGLRRAGEDFTEGTVIALPGQVLGSRQAAFAAAARVGEAEVRVPEVMIFTNNAVQDHCGLLLAHFARAEGARVRRVAIETQNLDALTLAITTANADLILVVGGSGLGACDHAAAALAKAGKISAWGLAVRPGETMGCGGIPRQAGFAPIVLIPGRMEAAFAAWLLLVRDCLTRLNGKTDRPKCKRQGLTRKIVSLPGMSDLVLLRETQTGEDMPGEDLQWEPLATGDLPWAAIIAADAWLVVPPDAEGYAAGEPVSAELL
jgi:molybdopterin biosynthesis enzyme